MTEPDSLGDKKPDPLQQLSPQRLQTLLKYCRNNPAFLHDPPSFPRTLKLIGSDLATDHDSSPKSPEEVLALLDCWKNRVTPAEPSTLRPQDREFKRLLEALENKLTFTQITLILQHLEVVGSGSETLWPTIGVEMRGLKFPPRPEVYWRWGFEEWARQARQAYREEPEGLSALQQRYIDFLLERGEFDSGGDGPVGMDALELVINHCRACLEVLKMGSPKVYLFEALGVGTTLADKINVCFGSGISVEERLPKYVCGRCVEQVDAAYGLKMQIDRTDEELRSLIAEYSSKPSVEETTEDAHTEQHFEEHDVGMDEDGGSQEVTVYQEVTTKPDPDVSEQLQDQEEMVEEEEEMEHEYMVVESEEVYELSEEQQKFTIRVLDEEDQSDESPTLTTDENIKKTVDPATSKALPPPPTPQPLETDKSFYQCTQCRVVLRTYELYETHLARHEQDRSFACQYAHCTKKFRSASTLKVHQRIHTNEKPYVCDICDKRFAQNTNLVYHRKVHQNIRDFACDQCTYRARNQNDLNLHRRRHTGARPYVCEECQLPFSTSSNLSKHVKRRHMGERKYKCDQCDKTFTTKETAQKHLVTHTGTKPFNCPECNVAYGWYNGLQKHLKSVHPGRPIPTEKSMMVKLQQQEQREAEKAVVVVEAAETDGEGEI